MGEKLSSEEAEIYDRQIRLWGIESQERLRASNVLIINVRGLGSEIAKNILLSGINSLTMLDNGIVTEELIGKNFFLHRDFVGKKIVDAVSSKAQALNPLVKLVTECDDVSNKDESYFSDFTCVIATGLNTKQILSISSACRKHNVKFICGDIFGMFGYSVSDFQEHEYFEEQVKLVMSKKRSHEGEPKKYEKTTEKINNNISFVDVKKVLVLPEEQIKIKRRNPLYFPVLTFLEFRNKYGRNPCIKQNEEDTKNLKDIRNDICSLFHYDAAKIKDEIFENCFGEFGPVASVVGGVMCQEVIKALSHKDVPINNVFLLDPFSYDGREENICNDINI